MNRILIKKIIVEIPEFHLFTSVMNECALCCNEWWVFEIMIYKCAILPNLYCYMNVINDNVLREDYMLYVEVIGHLSRSGQLLG